MANKELLTTGIVLVVLLALLIVMHLLYYRSKSKITSKHYYVQAMRMCCMIEDHLKMFSASHDINTWILYHKYIGSNIDIVKRNLTHWVKDAKQVTEIENRLEVLEATFKTQCDLYAQLAKIPKTEELDNE